MKMTLNDAALAMQAEAPAELDGQFDSVSTDSRKVRPGQLFFCLRGDNFDGHDYAAQAAASGAAALVADRPLELTTPCPVLLVADTLMALGRLANAWRGQSRATVIGVTGTAGKTTVKELLAGILSRLGPTAKSHKNFNNRVGLPLNILATTGQEQYWVMEAGISEPGEMELLGRILEPDMAVITNVGPGHLSGLGDVTGVATNKSRLLAYLKPGGRAFINIDCPDLVRESRLITDQVYGFSGADENAFYYGAYLGPAGTAGSGTGRFLLRFGAESLVLTLPRRGRFWAENFIAAAGAAHMLGAALEQIRDGLEEAEFPEQRFMCRQIGGWLIMDDAYNANPLSMRAALQAASEMALGRDLVCVMGEMRELGQEAADLHHHLGLEIAACGCQAVLWHGGFKDQVRAGLAQGRFGGRFCSFGDLDSFRQAWSDLGMPAGAVLVKGSRANRLDEIVDFLSQEFRRAL